MSGEAEKTITVNKASLLVVVRHLDFGGGTTEQFMEAFDEMRMAFTPDEIAYGVIDND
jgi:hypothetical protein